MKKLALLFFLLILAACKDAPLLQVQLQPCCEAEEKLGTVTFSIYSDGAVLNVHGQDIAMQEQTDKDSYGDVYLLSWDGVIPESGEKISVSADYNSHDYTISGFSVSLNKMSYGTDVLIPVTLDKYKVPSANYKCARQISAKTTVAAGQIFVGRENEWYEYRGYEYPHTRYSYEVIPAKDAIKISANWDYDNLKLYDSGAEPHEQDACETLARLDEYIKSRGWDQKVVYYTDEIKCASPDKVVYLGCEKLRNAQFSYLKLNICTDGRFTIYEDIFNGGFYDYDYIPEKKTVDFGTIYSAGNGMHKLEILYRPDNDMWFARDSRASGAYTACQVGQLSQNQICAHKIASMTQLEPDGSISVATEQSQIATEAGHEITQHFVTLTQEQALDISKNWDYQNMKLYSLGTEPHESDACSVLGRLSNVIRSIQDKKQE